MDENILKITEAVYKILDIMPEGDPLKNKAKEKALLILENLTLVLDNYKWVSLKDYFSEEKENIKIKILEDIEILENYLGIGKSQGWIRGINFLIIVKGYDDIKNSIKLSRGLIKSGLDIAIKNEDKKDKKEIKKGIIKETKRQGIPEDFSERQKKIIKILSDREKAQVSDIIKEIPNITKRTIRRDLDDLMRKERITRVGEWNQVFYQISDRT